MIDEFLFIHVGLFICYSFIFPYLFVYFFLFIHLFIYSICIFIHFIYINLLIDCFWFID